MRLVKVNILNCHPVSKLPNINNKIYFFFESLFTHRFKLAMGKVVNRKCFNLKLF